MTDQYNNCNISRQILLIDVRLNYIRRNDIESKNDCCIWVEIKHKGQNSFLLMGGYRQWTLPKENNVNQTS